MEILECEKYPKRYRVSWLRSGIPGQVAEHSGRCSNSGSGWGRGSWKYKIYPYLGVSRKRACWFGFGYCVHNNDDNRYDFGKSSSCYSGNTVWFEWVCVQFYLSVITRIFKAIRSTMKQCYPKNETPSLQENLFRVVQTALAVVWSLNVKIV